VRVSMRDHRIQFCRPGIRLNYDQKCDDIHIGASPFANFPVYLFYEHEEAHFYPEDPEEILNRRAKNCSRPRPPVLLTKTGYLGRNFGLGLCNQLWPSVRPRPRSGIAGEP